jgi:hypothetical protein
MGFRVKIKIEVVNEDGEEVNHKGYPGIVGRPFTPLATEQEFFEYEDISEAHATLNALHKTIQAIGEIA